MNCIHCQQAIRPPAKWSEESYYRHVETNRIGCYKYGVEPYAEPEEGEFDKYVSNLPVNNPILVPTGPKVTAFHQSVGRGTRIVVNFFQNSRPKDGNSDDRFGYARWIIHALRIIIR